MSEPFIGQIMMVGFNFAPRGWAQCDGQLLAISQYTALFSLLGTTYGGDGRTTFGLPDLRGRFPMHEGNGPGLTPRVLGQRSGTERNFLTVNDLPSHNHTGNVRASGNGANTNHPGSNRLGLAEAYSDQPASMEMNPDSLRINNAGGNQPVNNMPPFLVVNFVIALNGIFPSRS